MKTSILDKKMTRKQFLKLLGVGLLVAALYNKHLLQDLVQEDDIIINGQKIGKIKR